MTTVKYKVTTRSQVARESSIRMIALTRHKTDNCCFVPSEVQYVWSESTSRRLAPGKFPEFMLAVIKQSFKQQRLK